MNEQTGAIRTVRISADIQDNGIIRDAMTGWIIGRASYDSGSAIDYLADKIAIAAEPSKDAVELAVTIGTLAIRCGFQSDYTYRDQAAALIEAALQKVQEECAEKARKAAIKRLMEKYGLDRMESEDVAEVIEDDIMGSK